MNVALPTTAIGYCSQQLYISIQHNVLVKLVSYSIRYTDTGCFLFSAGHVTRAHHSAIGTPPYLLYPLMHQ
jgi:hypothetical protein